MKLFADVRVMPVRIARPTDRLDEIECFHHRVVGLPKITSWQRGIDGDHAGDDGLVLGMPDGRDHLEFTHSHDQASYPCRAPSADSILVFDLDADAVERMASRMQAFGIAEVEPENPWWKAGCHTCEDPDGWRVVFMTGPGVTRLPVAADDADDDSPMASTTNGTPA